MVLARDGASERLRKPQSAISRPAVHLAVIRIGAGETRAMRFVLQTFAQLHRENPGVVIELYTGNADAVEERLERGLLDFALPT